MARHYKTNKNAVDEVMQEIRMHEEEIAKLKKEVQDYMVEYDISKLIGNYSTITKSIIAPSNVFDTKEFKNDPAYSEYFEKYNTIKSGHVRYIYTDKFVKKYQ